MYRPARPRWSDSEKRAGSKDVVSPSCAHHKTPHPRSHSSRHIIDSSRSKLFENKYQITRSRALRPREAGRRPRGVSTPGGSACRDVCARGRARDVRVRVSRVSLCYFVAVCLVPGSRSAHGGRVCGGCGMRMGYLRCGPCSSMLQQERSQERDAASVHAGVRERPATEVRVLGLLVLPPRAVMKFSLARAPPSDPGAHCSSTLRQTATGRFRRRRAWRWRTRCPWRSAS